MISMGDRDSVAVARPVHVVVSPAFLAELECQQELARQAMTAALASGDTDAIEVAAARLADLADLARRHGR